MLGLNGTHLTPDLQERLTLTSPQDCHEQPEVTSPHKSPRLALQLSVAERRYPLGTLGCCN